MLGELAQVHWQLGQTLLPEHFVAQETALLIDSSIRFSLTGKPFYGLAQLALDLSETAKDIVGISEFCCILPSGELIKLNANAEFLFNRGQVILPKSAVCADLYINIYEHNALTAQDIRLELQQDTECNIALGNDDVVRKGYVLEVISVPNFRDEATSEVEMLSRRAKLTQIHQFKLVHFAKNSAQNWLPDERYLPPLLVLSHSSLFAKRAQKLQQYLTCFKTELEEPILQAIEARNSQQAALSAIECQQQRDASEQQSAEVIKAHQLSLLSSLYKTQRMLNTITQTDSEVLVHPYELFCQLEAFYIDCKLYRNGLPHTDAIVYRHNALAEVFDKLIDLLDEVIFLKEYSYRHSALRETNGIYSCAVDADAAQENTRFYLAIYHESQAQVGQCPVPSLVSSEARLRSATTDTIESLKLIQVTSDTVLARLNKNRLHDRGAQYYEVHKDGEWHNVVKAHSFAFYGQSEFRGYLFEFITETKNYAARR